MIETGLLLASGGALGAYDVGVLRRIYEVEPAFQPRVVSGISVGAIHAALIAATPGSPVAVMETFWRRLARSSVPLLPEPIESALSLFFNPGFYWMRQDILLAPFWTHLYDPTPLKRLIEEFVDFDRLNTSPIHVVVSAANVETGLVTYFENQGPHKSPLTADHLLACTMLPPIFPMWTVDQQLFWDGGLFDPFPLLPVISRMGEGNTIKRRLIYVSLFARQGKIPNNLREVYIRMIQLQMANKYDMQLSILAQLPGVSEMANLLNRYLPEDSPFRSTPLYRHMHLLQSISPIHTITNSDPALTQSDLSLNNIAQRMEQGYQDAIRGFPVVL